MVIIRKNWQALPVTATTVTAPDPIQQPVNPIQQPTGCLSLGRGDSPAPIQQPTADIVELNEINHNEPNEPVANTYQYSSRPPLVWPKKRSRIIARRPPQPVLFQLFITDGRRGGASRPCLHHVSGTGIARPGQDSLSGFY